jgi:hypothetical protein
MDVAKQGGLPPARIVPIDEFQAWAGFDPRLVARAALLLATVAIAWLLARGLHDRRLIPLSVMLQVHAYALLGTSVHENHTLLAVMLAPLLLGEWPKARAALAPRLCVRVPRACSQAAGFGPARHALAGSGGIAVPHGRRPLGSVWGAAHVALVGWLFMEVVRTSASQIARERFGNRT